MFFTKAVVEMIPWVVDAHLAPLLVHKLDFRDITEHFIVVCTLDPLDWSIRIEVDYFFVTKRDALFLEDLR